MSKTEHDLRLILAHRVAGHKGYYDDGELQDNSEQPYIDFLRDTPQQISGKLVNRAMAKVLSYD